MRVDVIGGGEGGSKNNVHWTLSVAMVEFRLSPKQLSASFFQISLATEMENGVAYKKKCVPHDRAPDNNHPHQGTWYLIMCNPDYQE